MPPLTTTIQKTTRILSQRAIRQEKEIKKHLNLKGKSKIISIHRLYDLIRTKP